MKRTQLYFISLAILSLLLLACGGKQSKQESELLGKWELIKIEPNIVTSDSVLTAKLEKELYSLPLKDEGGNSLSMTIIDNGILKINDRDEGTYAIDGDKLSLRMNQDTLNNDFKIKGDTLILSSDLKNIYPQEEMDIMEAEVEKLVMRLFLVRK